MATKSIHYFFKNVTDTKLLQVEEFKKIFDELLI